jgi:hypothetical protein
MVMPPSKKVRETEPYWSFLGKSNVYRLSAPDITKAAPSIAAASEIRLKAALSYSMLNFSCFDT